MVPGLLPTFLHSCEKKSGSGLGTRLLKRNVLMELITLVHGLLLQCNICCRILFQCPSCMWRGGGGGGEGKMTARARIYTPNFHRYNSSWICQKGTPGQIFWDFVFVTKGRSLTTLPTICMSQNSNYLLETVLRVSELAGALHCCVAKRSLLVCETFSTLYTKVSSLE